MSSQNAEGLGELAPSSKSLLLPEETGPALGRSLPSWDSARFDIPVDVALFEKLTEEMKDQEEKTRPAEWWMLPQSYLVGTWKACSTRGAATSVKLRLATPNVSLPCLVPQTCFPLRGTFATRLTIWAY